MLTEKQFRKSAQLELQDNIQRDHQSSEYYAKRNLKNHSKKETGIHKKALELAEDVHGTLAELLFTETELTKDKIDEINRYYFEAYSISGLSFFNGSIPEGIHYAGKDIEFEKAINDLDFHEKIMNPLNILQLYQPEWDKETLEDQFAEVNSYLNPEL